MAFQFYFYKKFWLKNVFVCVVRSNLDFKGKHIDEELWDVLARTKLSDRVNAMPMKLDTVVSNREAGLSLGECQLMCLARSLLERCKVRNLH